MREVSERQRQAASGQRVCLPGPQRRGDARHREVPSGSRKGPPFLPTVRPSAGVGAPLGTLELLSPEGV